MIPLSEPLKLEGFRERAAGVLGIRVVLFHWAEPYEAAKNQPKFMAPISPQQIPEPLIPLEPLQASQSDATASLS